MTSQPDNSTNDAQNDIANSTEIDDETDIPDYDQESPQERDRDRDRAFVASNGNFERLDPRYILRNDDRRDFFCLGRVLMIIFSDAMGYNVSANARPSKGTEVSDSSVVKLGQEFHFSERRMVIVNPGGGQGQAYSICVPVSTYRGQGALKHGIRKQNHAMLYKQFCFEAPKDEERMTKTPIEMIPTDPGEKWHPASRIDFGRLHTVQYNIPIRDVGMVHPDQIYLIGKYYRDTHFPRKRNSWRPPLPRSDLSNAGQPSLATLSSSGAYSGGRASAPSEAYSNQPTYSGTSFRGQPQEGMVEWNDPNRNTVPNPSGYQRRPGSYATR
ncbi:MAG: hypothetical protein M1814_005612 [Vezdaea aestivalis]|nr:MAG: hypothetical protein M1814_005612 [Vezdaea aestivalis]